MEFEISVKDYSRTNNAEILENILSVTIFAEIHKILQDKKQSTGILKAFDVHIIKKKMYVG